MRCSLALSSVVLAAGTAAASQQLAAAPAADLQPLLNQASTGNASFLGADVCTSIALDDAGRQHLFLFGDTLIGRFLPNGTRQIAGMPRNSVGVLYTHTAADGAVRPLSTLSHSYRHDAADATHVGFFSPPESDAQWYWPTAGARVRGVTYVVAMRMEASGSGEFPFSMAGMDVITLPADADGSRFADPLAWPAQLPTTTIGAFVNDNFTVGNAVTYWPADDAVYMLGSYRGARSVASPSAFMTRTAAAAWAAQDFAAGLEFLLANGSWVPHYAAIGDDLQLLFDFDVPSETTITWSAGLGGFVLLIANSFLYDSVMMRTAPAWGGPWSAPAPLYKIPPFMAANGSFCYAAKSHPELVTDPMAEFVFSYNCNVQGFPPLLDRPEIYTPQFVRVAISAA